jgi:glycine reductase
VVQYLNQFFGGIGGEGKASEKPHVVGGAVGPGRAVQVALGKRSEVVATVICGDNYFADSMDEAIREVIQLITSCRPEIVIAGPAFNAGRYGVACGAVCKAVQEKMDIPAVTGMYEENPGVGLYKQSVHIIKTADSVIGMNEAVSKMVNLAYKLATKQEIGKPAEGGYFPQGILKVETSDKTAAQRVVEMLLAKLQGNPYETELPLPQFEQVRPAAAVKDLSSSKIALITDGGLVPKGNPDNIEMLNATKFGKYSIKDVDKLNPEDYEVVHLGYDPSAVSRDPHRLVPLDIMRDLEKVGTLGKLCDNFYSTTGVVTNLGNSKRIAQGIIEQLKTEDVNGAILTST